LIRARTLVRDDSTVRKELQERFTHIFVDEFQDTSILQAEFLLLLAAADPTTTAWQDAHPKDGKLFIVGDPKQSIYRFRRADIRAYEAIKQQLAAHDVASLTLTTSFRSVPAIQRAVNAAFTPVMTGPNVHQPYYAPLTEYRADTNGQPALVVVPVPAPYGQNAEIAKKAMRASIPDATAAFIDWLLRHSGWTVEEDGDRVPIIARHICLLFRKYAEYTSDLTHPYVVALEARDIPHIVVGGRTLHGREEIETLRAALSAIEYPDDELSLYATLRGSLFTLPDALLFEYSSAHPLDYTKVPADIAPQFNELADALRFLRSLHRARNSRPVADTVMRLLEHTRAFVNFVFRPSGEQVLANVLLIDELARSYDISEGVSFRGFVEQLENDAERGQATEAPTLEEGSEGVRMMTVHKAKGLEFPVVILADLCAPLRNNNATQYVDSTRSLAAMALAGCAPRELLDNASLVLDEDAAEIARLTYVAATRARDLLVVTALGDCPYDEGWLSPLSAAIYPSATTTALTPHPPYCNGFGNHTTIKRPDSITTPSVHPGAYEFGGAAPYTVVWWDPARLDLGRTPRFGIRQDTLLTNDVAPEVVDRDVARYEEWRAERHATIGMGILPTLTVRRATDAAREATDEPPPVVTMNVPRPEGERRPKGPRFGSLVHAILAVVPLDAGRTLIDDCSILSGRILRSNEEDVLAAADAVERTLAHPLLARARAAETRGNCRRETPVTITDADGHLIEGVVDLAFGESDGWTVVDFKTDSDVGGDQTVYERQVGTYAEAIAKSTGQRCNGILLRI
jgi:ATP-dependent exoDNAse (exonuclease V) beta subunit